MHLKIFFLNDFGGTKKLTVFRFQMILYMDDNVAWLVALTNLVD